MSRDPQQDTILPPKSYDLLHIVLCQEIRLGSPDRSPHERVGSGDETNLHNGCDELLHKVVSEEVGPVVVDKVDDKSFDVRAVLVLISHDHQPAVAK